MNDREPFHQLSNIMENVVKMSTLANMWKQTIKQALKINLIELNEITYASDKAIETSHILR